MNRCAGLWQAGSICRCKMNKALPPAAIFNQIFSASSNGSILNTHMHPDYSTILIVDNAEFIRMVARLRLEGAGVPPGKIHEAENGQAAYDLLVAKGIANILCDYEMAVMNGIELAIRLLIEEQRLGLRFVLFSGTPPAKITAALAKTGLNIPVVPKTQLRENWVQTDFINAWFPELAIILSRQ